MRRRTLDILVNNLGIYEIKDFADITDDGLAPLLRGQRAQRGAPGRAYFPGMLKRNWGRIIFISSESGLVTPGPHDPLRHDQDGAACRFARSRRVDEGHEGDGKFRVAGPDALRRHHRLSEEPRQRSRQHRPSRSKPNSLPRRRPSSLLQRLIEPDEIANLVAYVASPLSSATNGAALRVDGGVTPTIG